MFPVLSDCPHGELMLSNGHWSCLLKDRDCLSWNTLCHLTGDCLNNTTGCRYCGKRDRWLFIHACLRVEQTTIIYYPGLGAGFLLVNILAVSHTPGLQMWKYLSTTEGQGWIFENSKIFSIPHIITLSIFRTFFLQHKPLSQKKKNNQD